MENVFFGQHSVSEGRFGGEEANIYIAALLISKTSLSCLLINKSKQLVK
jgi:hypothetical protein